MQLRWGLPFLLIVQMGAGLSPARQAAVVSNKAEKSPAATAPQVTPLLPRTDKQRALGEQAQRLVDMAADLKVEVDKTNRNILSLTVVRKAEEIEALARQMKDQAKK